MRDKQDKRQPSNTGHRANFRQPMKNHPHIRILETYFFGYIARGIGAEETPLFTRTLDGLPLSNVIAEKFGLPVHYAEAAINMARQEVVL